MQHYIDVVQDRSGNAIGNAIVTVKNNSSGQTAPTYSDSAGLIPLTSIMTANNGTFSFYIESGRYNISITKNGVLLNAINDIFITVTADYPTAMSQDDAIAGINLTPQTISADVLQGAMPTAMSYADAVAGTNTTPQSIAPNVLVASNIVQKYASVNNIPANFTGIAKVGTDLYVGDGSNLNKEVSSVYLSSSNTASQNTAAIQAALDNAGDVYVYGSGVRLINITLIIKSNTKLTLSADLILRLDTSSNCNILRNASASVNIQPSLFSRLSNVVTVVEKGHSRVAGDYVLISNLATDTSFNGLFLITSVVAGTSWTYASTGSNGSPTGVGFVAPANNKLVASNFVRSSNTVTVTESNHQRLIGDAVYIAGLATDTSFNGKYIVKTIVPGISWTYASTGSNGSPTGTGIVNGDNNITITGGVFDGDSTNQNIDYTASFGIILGCVSKIFILNTRHYNQDKYAIWIYNATDISANTLFFSTASDGLHFEGPCDRVTVTNLFGKTSDDMIAFTNVASTSPYNPYMSPCGLGDFGSISVNNIYLSNSSAPSAIKITGDSATVFDSLIINNVSGVFSSTGGYVLAYIDDGVGLTGMKLNNLTIDGMNVMGGSATSLVLSLAGTGGIGSCNLKNVTWNFISTFGISITTPIDKLRFDNFTNKSNLLSSANIAIHCNANINNFVMDGFSFNTTGADAHCIRVASNTINDFKMINGKVNGTSGNGDLIAQTGGTISRLTFNNVSCATNDALLLQSAGSCPIVNILNVTSNSLNKVLQNSGSMTINAVNLISNGVGNNVFQIAGGTVRINAKNCNLDSGQEILWNYNSSVISVNNSDASFGIDMGNPAATKAGETPLVGDMHWNSNATTKGLYGRTAASTWVKIF